VRIEEECFDGLLLFVRRVDCDGCGFESEGAGSTSDVGIERGSAMRNDGGHERQDDRVWPDSVHWELGLTSPHGAELLWRCDALRAGKLYQRSLFATKGEADSFAAKMREAEPDQMFAVEAIKASAVWN